MQVVVKLELEVIASQRYVGKSPRQPSTHVDSSGAATNVCVCLCAEQSDTTISCRHQRIVFVTYTLSVDQVHFLQLGLTEAVTVTIHSQVFIYVKYQIIEGGPEK